MNTETECGEVIILGMEFQIEIEWGSKELLVSAKWFNKKPLYSDGLKYKNNNSYWKVNKAIHIVQSLIPFVLESF